MNENRPPKPPLVDVNGLATPPKNPQSPRNDDFAVSEATLGRLDDALDALALRYALLPAQPQAEKKALEALKPFTRALSDDELDWLAAAGPGGPGMQTGQDDPEDPANPGKSIL